MTQPAVTTAVMSRLLMQHRAKLYAYILACVRDHGDTEEIMQTVAVAVMESSEQLRDEEGFVPWAREIARRRVLEHQRRSRREIALDPEMMETLDGAAARLDCAGQEEDRRREALLACLEELPPSSREVLAMRYDGTSAQEMSNRMGRSVQAVYAQVKRLKALLRECSERRLTLEAR